MPPSSSEKRLALAGAVLQFSDDMSELATRISWATPTAARYMSEQERESLASAAATITQVRDDLAELAEWLGEVTGEQP
jgi:hypothetical protein